MLKQNNFSSVNSKSQISKNIGSIFKSTEQRINQKFKTSQIFNTDSSQLNNFSNGITQDLVLSLNKLNTPKASILQIKNQIKVDSAQNFYSTQKQLNRNQSELIMQNDNLKNSDNVYLQSKFNKIEQKLNNLNVNDGKISQIENQKTLKNNQKLSIQNLQQKLNRFNSVKNLQDLQVKKQDDCFEYKDVLVSNIETLSEMSKSLQVLFEKTKLKNGTQLDSNLKNLKQYNNQFNKALIFNNESLAKSQKLQFSSQKNENPEKNQEILSPSLKMNILEKAEFNYKQSNMLQSKLDHLKIKLANNLCKTLHKVFLQKESKILLQNLKNINRQFIVNNGLQKFTNLLKSKFIKPNFKMIKKVPINFYQPQCYKSTKLYNNLQNSRLNSQTKYEEKVDDIFQRILDFESQEQSQHEGKIKSVSKIRAQNLDVQDNFNPIMKNIGNKITSIQDLKYQSALNKKKVLDLRMNNI